MTQPEHRMMGRPPPPDYTGTIQERIAQYEQFLETCGDMRMHGIVTDLLYLLRQQV